jgi:hypothetical protein
VKAPSYRVARRIVNILGYGVAVREYADLKLADLVLVAVPDRSAAAAIEQLAHAPLPWQGRSAVLCGSRRNSRALLPLAARGATIGCLDPIPGLREDHYALEGDREALTRVRALLGDCRRRCIEIHADAKDRFLAALWMASAGVLPVIDGAVMNLRHAGVERRAAVPIVEELVLKSVRGYSRAGRKARHAPRPWPGEAPERPNETAAVLCALAAAGD